MSGATIPNTGLNPTVISAPPSTICAATGPVTPVSTSCRRMPSAAVTRSRGTRFRTTRAQHDNRPVEERQSGHFARRLGLRRRCRKGVRELGRLRGLSVDGENRARDQHGGDRYLMNQLTCGASERASEPPTFAALNTTAATVGRRERPVHRSFSGGGSAPAQRRARERVGESEGRSPSGKTNSVRARIGGAPVISHRRMHVSATGPAASPWGA